MRLYLRAAIVTNAGWYEERGLPAFGFVAHFYGTATRTLDAHRGLATMNVRWIESSVVASPIPILLMHSASIRLRGKARRDALWKLLIDEIAVAHPVGEGRFRSNFSLRVCSSFCSSFESIVIFFYQLLCQLFTKSFIQLDKQDKHGGRYYSFVIKL